MDRMTRKEAKERTRQRLIEAVLEHVRTSGLGGLTTGKIAEAAGIAQSSFYVHFTDMDDLLQAAADKLGTETNAVIRAERHRLVRHASDPAASLRAVYEATLNAVMAVPAFAELLIGHRRDTTSPLGETLRAIVDQARQDFMNDLVEFGWDADDPHLAVHVELIVGATFTVVEAFLDGRLKDRAACLDALVAMTQALFPQ